MPVGALVPGSLSGGGDLAAWISSDLGFFLLNLHLRRSEGRVERRTDAQSNKGVAVNHLLQSDCGGRRLSLAGLGGEGEKASLLATNGVNELLAGRGGEEEPSRAISSSTVDGRSYLRRFWCISS
jgi:hypothetical protein